MSKALKPIMVEDESQYQGEWVALDPKTREVVAHNRELKIAAQEAAKKGYNDPVFHPVHESDFHGHFRITE